MKLAADASALLAILLDEPDADFYLARLASATKVWISPVNWWEVQVRMRSRYGGAGEARSAAWMESLGIVVEPVTAAQAIAAVEAFGRYGGRPARLNMGDCFAYALARSNGVALLYKGADFAVTDVMGA